ncbi:uncharacterized protein LOC108678794 [Hyalella azteca]|uniref:Uncharacterized protein LOC108678794 n=1 Tax=Hyalella azteca TaxID=294128 RepID=A0A8B7P9L5_HYAAZ|nr:uncharacterized protein LOC108678794 [Hyalella azteca]
MQSVIALLCLASLALGLPGHSGPRMSAEERSCYKALKAGEDKADMEVKMNACITEQKGLPDIIKSFKDDGDRWHGDGMEGGMEGGDDMKMLELCQLLDMNGHADMAVALMKCMVTKNGGVKADGSFNIEGLKAELLARVAGSSLEVNTRMGLDACPTDDLLKFNVMAYMKCVTSYCATGAGPTTTIMATMATTNTSMATTTTNASMATTNITTSAPTSTTKLP